MTWLQSSNDFCLRLVFFATLVLISTLGKAETNEPPVPAGLDPGGVAVALVGGGVNYTSKHLADRLARDGEGDLIAWDFVDDDNKPFALSGTGTNDALRLIEGNDVVRIIVLKERKNDPTSIGQASDFVRQTPARVLAWPNGNPGRPDWPLLTQAARAFGNILLIVPAPKTIPERMSNVFYAGARQRVTNRRNACLDAAVRAAKFLRNDPSLSAEQLKTNMENWAKSRD
ncbi:MAG: hypothetical protein ACR2PG_13210 [Hyphomicrobiaceae bacterium]